MGCSLLFFVLIKSPFYSLSFSLLPALSLTFTSLYPTSTLGIFGSSLSEKALRTKLVECSQTLTHRGPDWSGYHVDGDVGIAHERLAIIDPDSGAQPLVSRDENVIVAANGEIYNYQELLEGLSAKYLPRTGSDCECVIPLYQQLGIENFPNVSFLSFFFFLSFFLSFLVCIWIASYFPSISTCMHVCARVFQSTNVFIHFSFVTWSITLTY